MIHISKNKCVGCGLCVDECVHGCIELVDGVAYNRIDGCRQCNVCIGVCPQAAIINVDEVIMIAIGTDDGTLIQGKDHFGMAEQYQVWSYADNEVQYVETRKNVKYEEDESIKHGDPGKANATAEALKNIDVLVGKRFGPNISRLKNKFVCAVVRGDPSIPRGIEIIRENINEILEEKNSPKRKGLVLQ